MRHKLRKYVFFYINGTPYKISGFQAFMNLSRFLREVLLKSGTKVVCEEGDCGSCTVLVGEPDKNANTLNYKMINSCIAPVYSLDGMHIITIEGLSDAKELTEVQEKIACHGGSQCGYCTPGIVMALTALNENKVHYKNEAIKSYLTGNLCRCTGYLPIIESGLAVDAAKMKPINEIYANPQLILDLKETQAEPILLEHNPITYFAPTSLTQALKYKAAHNDVSVVSGFTDIGVEQNKKDILRTKLLSLHRIKGLKKHKQVGDFYSAGPKTTISDIETEYRKIFPDFCRYLNIFASPQIKNRATLIGNIANGSPISDTLPFLYILDAELEITSLKGKRSAKVKDVFKGYRQLDLENDEAITAVKFPKKFEHKKFFLYKISKRRDLDIATVTAAFFLSLNKNSNIILDLRVAFGGIGPMIMRFEDLEHEAKGCEFNNEFIEGIINKVLTRITPISDVRGSREFRERLVINLLKKFFIEASPI